MGLEQQIVTKNIDKSIELYTNIFLIKNTAPYIRKECRVRLEDKRQNSFNCWKSLKLVKLQRKDEISLSVNVTKVEKIN